MLTNNKGPGPASTNYVIGDMQTEMDETLVNSMLGYVTKNTNKLMRCYNGNGKKRLTLAHQNLQGGKMSTDEKIVQVQQAITATLPDVLGISETEMSKSMELECNVPGYKWEVKEDNSRISVLVNENIDYRRRKDLERPHIAAIWIEICPKLKNPILVCNQYREWRILGVEGSHLHVPNEERWKVFVEVLKSVANSGQEFHWMGDINLNRDRWQQVALQRLDDDSDSGYDSDTGQQRPPFRPEWWQKLVDHLYSEVMSDHPEVVQLVKKPTWFKKTDTGPKSSTLDLYFTNQPLKLTSLAIMNAVKSDHCMLVAHRRTQTKFPKPSIIRKRQWSRVDWRAFKLQMEKTTVQADVINCEDPDEAAERLTAAIRVHLDIQAEVKNYQVRSNYNPWIDDSLKQKILQRQKLFSIWKATGDPADHEAFKELRNHIVKDLKKKKGDYLKQKLKSTLNSEDVWEAGKSHLGWKTPGAPTSLSVNGELTSKNDVMAQAQSDFFEDKVKSTYEKIPKSDKDPLDYTRRFLQDKYVPEFNLGTTSEDEVIEVIESLKASDACGPDDISTNCLKEIKDIIAAPMAHIVNLSLESGIFPKIWKTAKTVPLFKNNGDRTNSKCYRPIALLNSLSKILEKIVGDRLNHHLESWRLYSDKQHGYRRKRSTATCLLQLQEEVMTRYEKGQDTALLMFDSSAAFDTVKHDILKEKLKLYGLTESAMKWFDSYLSQRYSYCEIGGKKSKTRKIEQGVFLFCILGPLLYILYINCITTLEDKNTTLSLYADDSTAGVSLTKNDDVNQERIKQKASEMQEYMNCNSLMFNSDKTQLLIKCRGTNNTHKDLTLEMTTGTIKQSEVVKVLGVYLSKDEQFKEYLITSENSMMRFLTTRLNMLKLLSRYADEKSRKALAEGLILSKINYCISLWGMTLLSILDKFQILLNKVTRVVTGCKIWDRLSDQYEKLRWLSIMQTRDYHDIISLESILRHKTPRSIAEKFEQDPKFTHRHFTRHSQDPTRLNRLTTSFNTTRHKGYVCRAARGYSKLPKVLHDIMTPRAVFKDSVRCRLGGFELKPRTLDYFLEQSRRKRYDEEAWRQ